MTIDCPGVLRIIGDQLDSLYADRLARVEYLGIICVILILKRRLSPYYVINLLDDQLPFTGIIEATNVVLSNEVGGKHLVYLPKYVPANDPMNDDDDEAIKTLFISNLKKVFPGLNDRDILYADVTREPHVQPLQDLDYLARTLDMRAPFKNVYLANTSMIYNSTLNNNAALGLAQKVVKMVKQDCG
jgi:protoporphyrinogen oxidase